LHFFQNIRSIVIRCFRGPCIPSWNRSDGTEIYPCRSDRWCIRNSYFESELGMRSSYLSEYCPANDFNYIQIRSPPTFPRNEGRTEITIGIEKSRSRIILMSRRVESTSVENYVKTLNSQLRLCHTRYQMQRSSVYQNYVEQYQITVTCPFLTSNLQLEEMNYYNSFSYCRGTTQVNIRSNRTEMKICLAEDLYFTDLQLTKARKNRYGSYDRPFENKNFSFDKPSRGIIVKWTQI